MYGASIIKLSVFIDQKHQSLNDFYVFSRLRMQGVGEFFIQNIRLQMIFRPYFFEKKDDLFINQSFNIAFQSV